MNLSYIVTGSGTISMLIDNKPFSVQKDFPRYSEVKESLINGDKEKLLSLLDIRKTIKEICGDGFKFINDTLFIQGREVNHTAVSKIIKFMQDGFDVSGMVNFIDRLVLGNPSKSSTDQLFDYAQMYQMPITPKGTFLAMKAVRADLRDKFSGKIQYVIGKEERMPRNQCVDDNNVGCAQSLHAGNIDYVLSYGSGDDVVILVECKPEDVVSCPNDCSYQKLRLCAITPIEILGTVKQFEDELNSRKFNSVSVEGLSNISKEAKDKLTYHNKRDSKGRFVKAS